MTRVLPDRWVPQGVGSLEDRAMQALREVERSVCVTAGAGAGKTEFLAQKATYLLQTGLCPEPRRILAISFKRDAAGNLAERVARRCPEHEKRFVSLTFDAFTKGLVDQFREAIPEPYKPVRDYEITYPTRDSLQDFLRRHRAGDVDHRKFERAIETVRLPIPDQKIKEQAKVLIDAYWHELYADPNRTPLSFGMINRLVDLMIRQNGQIRKALCSTYQFVLLDEFQDTTSAQYQLLKEIFHGSGISLTAVGDDKQKIMVWAGAMPDAFARFTHDFDARPIALLSNWRSHSDLVAIQHIIATHIDADTEPVEAKRQRKVDGDVSAVWQFPTTDEEISFVPGWIRKEVDKGEVQPEDFALLVRFHADRVEREIRPAFEASGLKLRNVARNVGGVAIQDLLDEDLVRLSLPFLRLGSVRRSPDAWAEALRQMQLLAGMSNDELEMQRINAETQRICRATRVWMDANPPGTRAAEELVKILIGEIGERRIRRVTSAYSREADFNRVLSGFVALLGEAQQDGESWSEALDRFEGKGQVPLMTIHKSKGLEFHTVIFLGLDNRSWWSLNPDNTEELNSFFVAFTRAEQRAFFTCCAGRGERIAWLEELLGDAVPTFNPNE